MVFASAVLSRSAADASNAYLGAGVSPRLGQFGKAVAIFRLELAPALRARHLPPTPPRYLLGLARWEYIRHRGFLPLPQRAHLTSLGNVSPQIRMRNFRKYQS